MSADAAEEALYEAEGYFGPGPGAAEEACDWIRRFTGSMSGHPLGPEHQRAVEEMIVRGPAGDGGAIAVSLRQERGCLGVAVSGTDRVASELARTSGEFATVAELAEMWGVDGSPRPGCTMWAILPESAYAPWETEAPTGVSLN